MSVSAVSLTVGQYLPGPSLVHRRDARLKLLGTVGFLAVAFAVNRWQGLVALGLGLGIALALVGARPAYLWRGLRPLVLLLALTFLLQLFGYPGEPLWRLGPFTITREGVETGAFISGRLVLVLVSGAVLTLSTPPVVLTTAVEWVIGPLRRLRVPTGDVALMMTIALRFIPTLLREVDDLVKAQRVRGADLTVRDPRRLGQALLPLAVPLFVLTFRHADDLAQAMTSRGYRGSQGRSRYRELRFGWGDAAATAAVAVWLASALAVGRGWGGW